MPPTLVRFTRSLAFIGVHAALSYGDSWFAGAALRAAVTVPTKPLVGLHVTQEQDVLPRESLPQVWLEVDGLSGGPLFEAFYRLCLVDGDIVGFRVSGNLLYKGNRISLLE